MILKSACLMAVIMCVLVLFIPGFAQEILDEMQIVDISDEPAIRSTIIRDPEQALLIVKSQISELRIKSKNLV